jgi:DNA-binding transcriptional LysR family regulator
MSPKPRALPRPSLLRRRVRLRQLELLAAFERARTLSAAARSVHLSQPAASKLLHALGADLGMQLFERAGRTLRPTAAGQALIRRAATVVGNLERTQAELEAIQGGQVGLAAIGAGMGASYVLVPKALVALLDEAPGLTVEVREGPMDELLALLRGGRLDMVVGRLDAALIERDLAIEELYDPPMCIVAGPRHSLARARRLAWSTLLAQEWILPQAGTPMRYGLEELFRRHRQRPTRCFVESSSIQTNVMLLGERDMLWVLSADIAVRLSELGLLRILPAGILRGPAPLAIVHLRDRALSPAALRVAGCLRQAGRPISQSYKGLARARA